MLFKGINIDDSINLGLKIWSINKNYLNDAEKYFDQGYYKYIELFIVPGSYEKFVNYWKELAIPFIIHAPHYREGLNLADKARESRNLILANEAMRFADDLNAEIIIFHPGVAGDTSETAKQLKALNEPRAIIENKPYLGLDDDLICNGYSPEEIKYVIDYSGAGFCLDFGHAICAANALKLDIKKFIHEFILLKPAMFHLSDGDNKGVYDSHLHFGQGNYKLNYLLNLLPDNSLLSIETVKNSKDNLDDFIEDVEFIKKKWLKIQLASKNDMIDVFNLSNDIDVRSNSFNSDQIVFENHLKWFNEKISSKNTNYLIIRNYNQQFIGQVRFDKIEMSNDWIIGISLTINFRGKGLSSIILIEAIDYFSGTNSNINIYAYIKKENTISVKSFLNAGFSIIGEMTIYDCESYQLKYSNK